MNAPWRIRQSLIGISARVSGARGKACPTHALLAKAFPGGTPTRPILAIHTSGASEAGTPEAERDVASDIAGGVTGRTIRHRYLWRQHHVPSPRYAATSGPISDPATHPKASQ